MSLSASRLEHTPALAIYLFSRIRSSLGESFLYDFGFEKYTITVFRQGAQLKASLYFQYSDPTKNTTQTYIMNHSTLFIPPILINPTLIFILPTP